MIEGIVVGITCLITGFFAGGWFQERKSRPPQDPISLEPCRACGSAVLPIYESGTLGPKLRFRLCTGCGERTDV